MKKIIFFVLIFVTIMVSTSGCAHKTIGYTCTIIGEIDSFEKTSNGIEISIKMATNEDAYTVLTNNPKMYSHEKFNVTNYVNSDQLSTVAEFLPDTVNTYILSKNSNIQYDNLTDLQKASKDHLMSFTIYNDQITEMEETQLVVSTEAEFDNSVVYELCPLCWVAPSELFQETNYLIIVWNNDMNIIFNDLELEVVTLGTQYMYYTDFNTNDNNKEFLFTTDYGENVVIAYDNTAKYKTIELYGKLSFPGDGTITATVDNNYSFYNQITVNKVSSLPGTVNDDGTVENGSDVIELDGTIENPWLSTYYPTDQRPYENIMGYFDYQVKYTYDDETLNSDGIINLDEFTSNMDTSQYSYTLTSDSQVYNEDGSLGQVLSGENLNVRPIEINTTTNQVLCELWDGTSGWINISEGMFVQEKLPVEIIE